ncbi:LytR/AlgR family response regulator transcription factor [Butyrivibrio sp. WCE2006]|uniref:LytR/AlgR family response regulator transcription factor n=1 Tax=Butyrivibrio sp. WCE2006 TaxID=1410611 RepID=UPI0005D2970A|nr:LytTR family DNA-binding domain-containing protein [Butyrivibrio sp. WCE2006]
MRIAICDDEEKVRQMLLMKVRTSFPEDLIETFENGEELLNTREIPDILLLDIKMPGILGMEVARRLRERTDKTVIIFITGEERFVFDSFDVHAFHYLVKPFSDEKLQEVLGSARAEAIKQSLSKGRTGHEKKYVMVNSKGTHVRICLDDVIYAEVFNSKVVVHATDSDIEYYGKLTDLEKIAGDDFFRTHRAYLIHLKYVKSYDASNVYLKKGQVLVSKQNYPKLVQKVLDYNRREGLF